MRPYNENKKLTPHTTIEIALTATPRDKYYDAGGIFYQWNWTNYALGLIITVFLSFFSMTISQCGYSRKSVRRKGNV